ncbi:TadE/TadG family type IV pilus assembly protein [Paludisphaera sp.]|uniref:TadE/TadG family type IV pilus assembly protein n=1 Tax=Paludisphaera sp. TaxID=2017432 RepID=UPI00301B9FB2
MIAGRRCRRRRGAALVEAAVVLPVFFLLLLGGTLLGARISNRQERDHLATSLGRWASLQGAGSITGEGLTKQLEHDLKTAGLKPEKLKITASPSSDGYTMVTVEYPRPTGTPPPLFTVTKKVWTPY